MLAQIAHDREAAALLFTAASEAQRKATELRGRLEREVDTVLRERDQILRTVRAEAEASLSDLRRELDQAEAEMRLAGTAPAESVSTLRQRVARAEQQQVTLLSERPEPKRPAPPSTPAPATDRGLQAGDHVTVLRTGQEGVVSNVLSGRKEVEVQIGPFKTRVKIKDVRLLAPGSEADNIDLPLSGGTRFHRSETPAPSLDLDMRGWRVDEVVPELERYLNDAFMANMPFVRLIHGKGTGALRQVVREELATNPLVSSFKGAEAREGGEGVTVVQMAI
jgi:DNA mismatch repair protein MutS2